MKHRIRAAGLVIDGDKILLVEHNHHGSVWWGPPGGGFEAEDASTVETVKRELHEETGLSVDVGELFYVREFYERHSGAYHVELFYRINHWQGEPSMINLKGLGGDEHVIQRVEWVHRNELPALKLYPEELKHALWQRLSSDVQGAEYLGSFSDV